MQNVILPELGEGIKKAVVVMWHKNIGDKICKDEDLVEVVTDKATFNVSATTDGILKKICVSVDTQADIGSVLAVIGGNK